MNETTNGTNCSPEQGAIDTTWKPKILAFCCNWCTYAGADLAGLGPLSVYVGTRDILSPDVRLLEQRARAAGVDVDLHVGHGLVHVYPLLPTRAGRLAREQIVADLTDRTDRG